MVDDQEQVLLELSFPEITKAQSEKSSRPFMQNFTLTTVRDEKFVFQSPNSGELFCFSVCFSVIEAELGVPVCSHAFSVLAVVLGNVTVWELLLGSY